MEFTVDTKEYIDQGFNQLKMEFEKFGNELEEIKQLLIGEHGKDGITHRLRRLEEDNIKIKNSQKKIMYGIVSAFITGSALWIKESRDFIITLILNLIGI